MPTLDLKQLEHQVGVVLATHTAEELLLRGKKLRCSESEDEFVFAVAAWVSWRGDLSVPDLLEAHEAYILNSYKLAPFNNPEENTNDKSDS